MCPDLWINKLPYNGLTDRENKYGRRHSLAVIIYLSHFLNVRFDNIDEYSNKCIDNACYVDIKLKRERNVLAKYV